MSNRSSCRILKFLGMDVKCDKSSSTDEANLGVSNVQNTVKAKKNKVDGTVQTNESNRENEREKKKDPNGPSSYGNM